MKRTLFVTLIGLTLASNTYAVRPFITDDAAITGRRQFQLETWALFDKFSGQHWSMLAYGPHKHLEVAIGAVLGYDQPQIGQTKFSYAMPLLEAKVLFREYQSGKAPGVGLVTGTFLPSGKGEFVAPGYGAYSFLALTQCFGENEDVLIHGNIGVNYLYTNNRNQYTAVWGFGTQIRAYKGLHLVGEIIAGDPYVPGTGLAYQAGVRYFISDLVQVDATVGQGIAGENKVPFWGGFGLRYVMTRFEKKHLTKIQ
ncbi:MAG: transporter [Bacteroidales bacterium]|nr:transporter [Bacteroidales bacterium]